jgi:hypothetical protein
MFGVLAANNLGFGAACCSGWNLPNFWPAAQPQPQGHEMSKISHITDPSCHCNITHWTHMEEMEWFSSAMFVVLAANNLGFGAAGWNLSKLLASGTATATGT